jgi:hypothetical protein
MPPSSSLRNKVLTSSIIFNWVKLRVLLPSISILLRLALHRPLSIFHVFVRVRACSHYSTPYYCYLLSFACRVIERELPLD